MKRTVLVALVALASSPAFAAPSLPGAGALKSLLSSRLSTGALPAPSAGLGSLPALPTVPAVASTFLVTLPGYGKGGASTSRSVTLPGLGTLSSSSSNTGKGGTATLEFGRKTQAAQADGLSVTPPSNSSGVSPGPSLLPPLTIGYARTSPGFGGPTSHLPTLPPVDLRFGGSLVPEFSNTGKGGHLTIGFGYSSSNL